MDVITPRMNATVSRHPMNAHTTAPMNGMTNKIVRTCRRMYTFAELWISSLTSCIECDLGFRVTMRLTKIAERYIANNPTRMEIIHKLNPDRSDPVIKLPKRIAPIKYNQRERVMGFLSSRSMQYRGYGGKIFLDYTWKTNEKGFFLAGYLYGILTMDYIFGDELNFPSLCNCLIVKKDKQAMTSTEIIQKRFDGTVMTVPGCIPKFTATRLQNARNGQTA